MLLGQESWLLILISPPSFVNSPDVVMIFCPFYDEQPLLPACLLWVDVNVIVSDKIFEPFEIRELEIIMKVEMTNFKSPKANSKPFLCCWMIYQPKALPGSGAGSLSFPLPFRIPPSTDIFQLLSYLPGHQDFSFKSSLVINLSKCHDVANSSRKWPKSRKEKIIDWGWSGFWILWHRHLQIDTCSSLQIKQNVWTR